jgi:hypothetical protein
MPPLAVASTYATLSLMMLRVLKSSLIVLVYYASFVSAVANSPREVSVDGVIARGSASHWDISLLQSTRCASDDDCGDDPAGRFVCYNVSSSCYAFV